MLRPRGVGWGRTWGQTGLALSLPSLSGLCPNVAARQHLATLQHLCHMRFVEVCGPQLEDRPRACGSAARTSLRPRLRGCRWKSCAWCPFAEKRVSGELGRLRAGESGPGDAWPGVGTDSLEHGGGCPRDSVCTGADWA